MLPSGGTGGGGGPPAPGPGNGGGGTSLTPPRVARSAAAANLPLRSTHLIDAVAPSLPAAVDAVATARVPVGRGRLGAWVSSIANRKELEEKGIDPRRLPPGQYLTDRFPCCTWATSPSTAPGEWNLTVFGLVERPFTLTLDELKELPSVTLTFDIHCVTKWSKFDTTWTGVRCA